MKFRFLAPVVSVALHQRYALPRAVEIRFDTCETVNAFYNPQDSNITFCYELLELLADVFVPDGQWTEEERANVFGAVQFIMMHEVGHALADVHSLGPVRLYNVMCRIYGSDPSSTARL